MRFELEPEVAGGLGEKTVMDTSQFPPLVSSLHYEVDGWLGDELLESFPCFIATETLAKKIKDSGLSGVEILDVFISKSSNFEELHPNTELPSFKWLYVNGDKSKDVEDINIVSGGEPNTFWMNQVYASTYYFKISDNNLMTAANNLFAEADWSQEDPYYFRISLTYHGGVSRYAAAE